MALIVPLSLGVIGQSDLLILPEARRVTRVSTAVLRIVLWMTLPICVWLCRVGRGEFGTMLGVATLRRPWVA
jgi:hypothetical protein